MTQNVSLPTLALVGLPAAGKGEGVKFFRALGYHPVITGDLIREELRELGNPQATREHEGEHGRRQRTQHGPGYFADFGMRRCDPPYFIEGSRSQGEVDDLLDRLGVILLGMTATLENRYRRVQARRSARDPLTWSHFVAMDRRDRGWVLDGTGGWIKHGDPATRDADYGLTRAHAIIHNDGSMADLRVALQECWGAIQAGLVGPGLPVLECGVSTASQVA